MIKNVLKKSQNKSTDRVNVKKLSSKDNSLNESDFNSL